MTEQRPDRPTVSVAIPTYRREGVLLDTIRQVLKQDPPADEVLVIDQTPKGEHEAKTEESLRAWHDAGRVRWISHAPPNLPAPRNRALLEATSDVVVFIDDDVVLCEGFVEGHRQCYGTSTVDVVTGPVIQSNQQPPAEMRANKAFRYPEDRQDYHWINRVQGGNLSVRRQLAVRAGGYDERFGQGAYREEADFAWRMLAVSGNLLLYQPTAWLLHLAAPSGGCRAWGHYLNPLAVGYSVGHYYFALKNLSAPNGGLLRGSPLPEYTQTVLPAASLAVAAVPLARDDRAAPRGSACHARAPLDTLHVVILLCAVSADFALTSDRMHIVFLAPQLPPAMCGVGDHTDRLSRAMVELGTTVAYLYLRPPVPPDGTLPGAASRWDGTCKSLQAFLRAQAADWLWVQFTCYGYQHYGVPLHFAWTLARLRRAMPKLRVAVCADEIHYRRDQLGRKGACWASGYTSAGG